MEKTDDQVELDSKLNGLKETRLVAMLIGATKCRYGRRFSRPNITNVVSGRPIAAIELERSSY